MLVFLKHFVVIAFAEYNSIENIHLILHISFFPITFQLYFFGRDTWLLFISNRATRESSVADFRVSFVQLVEQWIQVHTLSSVAAGAVAIYPTKWYYTGPKM